MASKNRFTTTAVLGSLVFALIALGGCTKVITSPAASPASTVTAAGTGTAQAKPDTGEMYFGVSKSSSNAKTALNNASKAAEKIATAVKKKGVSDEDIQTRDVSVYARTRYRNGREKVIGYQSSLSLRVKVRDLDKLGDVISAANSAGANNINGPTFTAADPAPTRAEAIEAAVADARKNAEAMAKAAGKSVGAVQSMSSTGAGGINSPQGFDAGFARYAMMSVPIQPGQLDITMNVTVIFELK